MFSNLILELHLQRAPTERKQMASNKCKIMNGVAIHKNMLQILKRIGSTSSLFICGSNHTHRALSLRDKIALKLVQNNERYTHQ